MSYVNMWKTTLRSTIWNMSQDFIAVEEEHSKQLANMTKNLEFSERQRRLMANSKYQ